MIVYIEQPIVEKVVSPDVLMDLPSDRLEELFFCVEIEDSDWSDGKTHLPISDIDFYGSYECDDMLDEYDAALIFVSNSSLPVLSGKLEDRDLIKIGEQEGFTIFSS